MAARNFLKRLQRYDNDELAAANRPEVIANMRTARAQLSPRGMGEHRLRGMSAPMLPNFYKAEKKPGLMSRFRHRLRKRASSPRDIPIKKIDD